MQLITLHEAQGESPRTVVKFPLAQNRRHQRSADEKIAHLLPRSARCPRKHLAEVLIVKRAKDRQFVVPWVSFVSCLAL